MGIVVLSESFTSPSSLYPERLLTTVSGTGTVAPMLPIVTQAVNLFMGPVQERRSRLHHPQDNPVLQRLHPLSLPHQRELLLQQLSRQHFRCQRTPNVEVKQDSHARDHHGAIVALNMAIAGPTLVSRAFPSSRLELTMKDYCNTASCQPQFGQCGSPAASSTLSTVRSSSASSSARSTSSSVRSSSISSTTTSSAAAASSSVSYQAKNFCMQAFNTPDALYWVTYVGDGSDLVLQPGNLTNLNVASFFNLLTSGQLMTVDGLLVTTTSATWSCVRLAHLHCG